MAGRVHVNTATPGFFLVHVDQLNRPVKMTDWAKTVRWSAEWTPWGAPHSITSAPSLNARFPGQWFQLEAGLHYNWHRHYDPSLGRYTQPDPLGFVDGPSVYAYARSLPGSLTDFSGRLTPSQVELPSRPPATDQCVCPFNDGTPSWFLEGGMMRNPCLGGGSGGGGGSRSSGPTKPGTTKPTTKTVEDHITDHAFDKHVLKQGEFPNIQTADQFRQMVRDILANPTKTKQLSNNREAYWSDTHGTIVIINRNRIDKSTAFKPRDGVKYFDNAIR